MIPLGVRIAAFLSVPHGRGDKRVCRGATVATVECFPPPVSTHERATNRSSQCALGLLLIRRGAVAAGPSQQVT